ncbi:DWNN-domain-containing protein [Wallemia mellicola]|nr:DWNN-domain-containing protein [Wallemia mellicola]TIC46886.1 DWNN-domain-containing protein [Wallemia mellicola]TIC51221.1 DWNN-domain-containing protein [Wallemia mellicola]
MGSIYYKFKSSKNSSRVNIDGTSLSVFDLKREILLSNRMAINKGNDFDLVLLRDTPGQEEYHDDNEMIPRSTSVIVKRSPPKIANRGTAAKYIADAPLLSANESNPLSNIPKPPLASMSKRFDGKDDSRPQQQLMQSVSAFELNLFTPQPLQSENNNQGSEQDAISAMFAASEQQWEETQQHMSMATPVYNVRPPVRRPAPASTSNGDNTTSNPSSVPTQQLQSQAQMSSFTSTMPTPPGYVCYRCGEKGLHFKLSKLINLIFLSGHWIQDCPTNGDPNYENKPRFKRTTGIPKSFLKTVDATTAASITNNGSNAAGVMITPDGSHVIATPDIATWEKSRAIKPVALTVNDIRESEPSDANLKCDLSGKLISNPIILPCCKKSYSEEYINQYLIENDFFCPNCHSNVGSLVNLSPNPPLKEKVVEYISQQLSLDRQKKDEEAKKNNQTDTKDEVEHTNKKGLFEDEINKINKLISDCQFAIMAIVEALNNKDLDDKLKFRFQTQLVQLNQILNLHQGQVMMMMNGMDPKVFGMPLLPELGRVDQNQQINIDEPLTNKKRSSADDDYYNSRPSKR